MTDEQQPDSDQQEALLGELSLGALSFYFPNWKEAPVTALYLLMEESFDEALAWAYKCYNEREIHLWERQVERNKKLMAAMARGAQEQEEQTSTIYEEMGKSIYLLTGIALGIGALVREVQKLPDKEIVSAVENSISEADLAAEMGPHAPDWADLSFTWGLITVRTYIRGLEELLLTWEGGCCFSVDDELVHEIVVRCMLISNLLMYIQLNVVLAENPEMEKELQHLVDSASGES